LEESSADAWAARAAAVSDEMPFPLHARAAAVNGTFVSNQLLCEWLQLLLGIDNGGCPNARDACNVTLSYCSPMPLLFPEVRNTVYQYQGRAHS
jgi:hypothetical protein